MGIMSDDYDRIHWPFRARYYQEIGWTYYACASERIEAVRRMTDLQRLRAALEVPDLQKSVQRAVLKRLREIGA